IRTLAKRRVPVPISPSILRRDVKAYAQKHARLMLVLFKPWTAVSDLKERDASWTDTYQAFYDTCAIRIHRLIDNMQILHECKDVRDDHFTKRARQSHAARAHLR
ncbi:hypothetical protein C8J56DRAFT_803865, partial [Mycena floridula]